MCQVQLPNAAPTPSANGGNYLIPAINSISAGTNVGPPSVGWQTPLPLLDYPGWKMTWVFCVRRPDPHSNTSNAFDVTHFSMYLGLANGYGGSSSWTVGPRPPVFYGVR